MSVFPVFLKLENRRVLVVGGGPVAASKLETLRRAGADVRVVAPEICSAIAESVPEVERRPFAPSDLDGVWLVVAAATPAVNQAVAAEAELRRIFVNAVDDPSNATAYLGGVVRRDGVTVAISTDGAAPALAGLFREALEELLPDESEVRGWLADAQRMRRCWTAAGVRMEERRPRLLEALNARYRRLAASSGAGR